MRKKRNNVHKLYIIISNSFLNTTHFAINSLMCVQVLALPRNMEMWIQISFCLLHLVHFIHPNHLTCWQNYRYALHYFIFLNNIMTFMKSIVTWEKKRREKKRKEKCSSKFQLLYLLLISLISFFTFCSDRYLFTILHPYSAVLHHIKFSHTRSFFHMTFS